MPFDKPATKYLYMLRAEFGDAEPEERWNAWYDEVHVPELLTVPGIRSATRYVERADARRYLAVYEIDDPQVFEHPRYREVCGWGEWEPYIVDYTRCVVERVVELDKL